MLIAEAVTRLRPGTMWTMAGDDVDNITWHTPNVTPITSTEIAGEISKMNTEASAKDAADAAATVAAIAHAKSLGFTDAMIAVMYPNLLTN